MTLLETACATAHRSREVLGAGQGEACARHGVYLPFHSLAVLCVFFFLNLIYKGKHKITFCMEGWEAFGDCKASAGHDTGLQCPLVP